jgi:Ser/Thr protein kinase RdoA (MazF antagonist)
MNVEEILKNEYGIDVESYERIDAGVINDNYHVKTRNGDYLLKNYKIDEKEKVEFEIDIYKKLEENNFPSPRIVKNLDNLLYNDDGLYILFDYINGEMLTRIDKITVRKVGGLLGEKHEIFSDYNHQVELTTWEPRDIEEILYSDYEKVENRDFKDSRVFVSFIKDEFSKLKLAESLLSGITHQDVKPENIIENNGEISLIDFNNCYYGVLLYDVMTFVIWALFNSEGRLNVSLFREYLMAYGDKRELTKIEIDSIFEALKFRLLREAYVWPYRWLDEKKARKYSWMFVDYYKDIIENEKDYKIELEKTWQN